MQLQWKDRYSIRYKEIDAQHQGLLAIINEVGGLQDAKTHPDEAMAIFRRLCAYAGEHFATEERYLEAAGYEHLERHKGEHARFIRRLLDWNADFTPGDPRLLTEFSDFLRDWYLRHIAGMDQEYAPWLHRLRTVAKIQAVTFDYGNVIARFDNRRFLAGIAPLCGSSVEELQQRFTEHQDLAHAFETGGMSARGFRLAISALCGTELPEAPFVRAFTDIFTPVPETLDLIPRLKARYKLGLISDTNELHFTHQIEQNPVFPLFDAVSLSFQVGTTKPDPRIFQHALDQLGLLAEECVYIDDRRDLIEGADSLCFHTIHCTGPEALAEGLKRLRILP